MADVKVEVRNLKRYFGSVKAVDDVSFDFIGGHVHGFIGPNGAGKTTAMRILATIDNPDSGDVLVNGLSIVDYPDKIRPRIGFMPDYLDTYEHMLVDEYLDFYARAYRLPSKKRHQRLEAVIEFTGLGGLLRRGVNALSKGQKQRLSLGRVLINDPDVLILDEPAAGLDPRARVELRNLIRKLADKGKAVFVSSHILTELSEVCDAVTIIESGKICASDSVQSLREEVDSGVRVGVVLNNPTDDDKEKLLLALGEIPGVEKVQEALHGATFSYVGEPEMRAKILAGLIEKQFVITDFNAATSDLEDTFMALTNGEVT